MTIEPIYLVLYAFGYAGLIWSTFASHKRAMKCIKQAKQTHSHLFLMSKNYLELTSDLVVVILDVMDKEEQIKKLKIELEKEKLKVTHLINPSIKINKACYQYYCNLCNERHLEILEPNEVFTGKCTKQKSKN